MAGQSGHNLNISKFRRGAPRFPFELKDVGEGYARAGPVIVRQLTPEERDKYPPVPVSARKGSLTAAAVRWAVKRAAGLAEAARMLGVSEVRLKSDMARFKVALPEEWEEGESMDIVQVEQDVQSDSVLLGEQSGALRNGDGRAPAEVRKVPEKLTREWLAEELKNRTVEEIQADFPGHIKVKFFAVKWGLLPKIKAEEVLPRERFVEYKRMGKTDREIIKETGVTQGDFYRLKRQYGLMEQGQSGKEVKEVPVSSGSRLTITRALELRNEHGHDLDDILRILREFDSLSPRVKKMLEYYRDEYRRVLDHIGEVFDKTEVYL